MRLPCLGFARWGALLALLMTPGSGLASSAQVDQPITVDELVTAVLEVNPQVKSARAQWNSALHQIKQNYVPADPTFGYNNIDSWRGIGAPGIHEYTVTQPVQFPGKALYQADMARRTAKIAQISYLATVRDTRAAAETGYYQALLDDALADVTAAQLADLARVVKVTQIKYEVNQATQSDVISAQFDYSTPKQSLAQARLAARNDLRNLNQLLFRRPDSPLLLSRKINLKPFRARLDSLVDRAVASRQEILEAALTEKNNDVALKLARMEYLPDFTFGYNFDDFAVPNFAPAPSHTQDHTIMIGLTVPIFAWWRQREDITKAQYDLEAAADNLASIRKQTEVAVTQLYDQVQLDYQIAVNYRDYLVPLARENFNVALVAYTGQKIEFADLSGAIQRSYNARIAYLQAVNQFYAQEVALEQTVGSPILQ